MQSCICETLELDSLRERVSAVLVTHPADIGVMFVVLMQHLR